MLLLGTEQVTMFGLMYGSAIQEYKASYFRERSSLSLFTRYMIPIINNCDRFEEKIVVSVNDDYDDNLAVEGIEPGDEEQMVEARPSR